MSHSLLRRYRVPLALSLAVHAGLVTLVALAGQGADVRPADAAAVRIALLREAPAGKGEHDPVPRAGNEAAPDPAAASRAPARAGREGRAAPRTEPMGRVVAARPEAVAAAEPAPVPERARALPAPGTDPARSAAVLPAAAGRESAARPSSGPPDWPTAAEVDRAARPRWPIRPDYPPRARREGRESLVVVAAWIDAGGHVAFSSVVESGGRDFDESARRAVDRSAFEPARLAGRDVASRLALRIHFQLYD